MESITDVFGILAEPEQLARDSMRSEFTSASPAMATTGATAGPAAGARGLLDPRGSALFWVGLAAVLGLILVTGHLKVSAALTGRGGKS